MDFHEFHHPVSSNMAMENRLFIGDFPIDTLILSGCPVATFEKTAGIAWDYVFEF